MIAALRRAACLLAACGTVASAQDSFNPALGSVSVTSRVIGTGPPIILIPGLASSGAVWDGIAQQLSKDYQCHLLTLAGFGGAPPVAVDNLWLSRMRDAIVRYARARRLDRPVLVGHSLGGVLALAVAIAEPTMPSLVVNIDGAPHLAGLLAESALRPGDVDMARLVRDSTALRLIRAERAASDPPTVAEAARALYLTDLRPQLPSIAAPVLNLHAWQAYRATGVTRAHVDAALARQYAGLRRQTTRVNDRARHFIMLDEPDWVVQQLRDAIADRTRDPAVPH